MHTSQSCFEMLRIVHAVVVSLSDLETIERKHNKFNTSILDLHTNPHTTIQ